VYSNDALQIRHGDKLPEGSKKMRHIWAIGVDERVKGIHLNIFDERNDMI
jgi:hypothetical protein